MGKENLPKPTDAELEILGVLWERGASTVREVHEVLNTRKLTGYTTILKLMQIMLEKGLVKRDESQRAHIYEAKFAREQTQRWLLTDLLNRVFDGSAVKLVMQALSTKRALPEELVEIRKVLDELERSDKK
ncbi:MAG: BlaI/MecI/CopY family transcriptional regulator [Acidobacteriota bacterium]